MSRTAPIAIIGAACRLPGAPDEAAFWRLLDEGRCAVGDLPDGRWPAGRYLHPRAAEPGFSYSFAGGYIDAPMGFDPGVFGISPREAAEMDPQQRLLLEIVWGALEDAGLPPSALAGANVGVYVGASSLDYGALHGTDPAAIESHFMTGNTLSVLANRISYIYDLRGPSFTIDTACSSSLVAFAEAQAAIASGRIDMAIVAGVNLLLSPTPFIGFSRASMLSPTGLCRPFSEDADGYVRAEGAVAMVLARLETAVDRHYTVRAVALASGINSDGRTNGIALPSADGQRALLERLYGAPGEADAIDRLRLAFVEAHGTGTRVGDPAEATAIGEALGRGRESPLPIGSVKSNIGHLEPASGLAGLLKAVLALEHRRLPASLHAGAGNPAIDFAGLNLAVARAAVALPASGTWLAGVSSFGFGGTNAHVVIRHAEPAEQPAARVNGAAGPPAALLVLSAHSRAALTETAGAYADMIAASAAADVTRLAAATGWQRDLAGHRLALAPGAPVAVAAALRGFAATGSLPAGVVGMAPSVAPVTCFVFSGNGCQWAGMGRAAFAESAAFRRRFTEIDRLFSGLADWSLVGMLHDEALATALSRTRIAQPLLFAVQSALVAGLAEWGLRPDMVLGHSVGEVAAAEAAGALGLAEAVHVIFHRSEQQEAMHGLGGMAVAGLSAEATAALIAACELDALEIAAVNGPGSVTVSGPEASIRGFAQAARSRRIAVRVLDLAYPFHSRLLEPLRQPLLAALGMIGSGLGGVGRGEVPFVSTVTGAVLAGEALDAEYWWTNVRAPVRFRDAVVAAARAGAGLFVEIGPRPILASNIADTLREAGLDGAVMASLQEKDARLADAAAPGPLALIAARALMAGCRLDQERLFGRRPTGRMRLPGYAWQRRDFVQPQSGEALDLYGAVPRHPLIGARLLAGTPEWRSLIDATVVPYLADHRIDGEIVVPGSAFAEMALAVAREVFPAGAVGLVDFDLLQWMPLPEAAMRELSVRLAGDTQVVEIRSRPRLGADEWTLHARGRIVQLASPAPAVVARAALPHAMTAETVYASAAAAGVEYGPAFRRVISAARNDVMLEVELSPVIEATGAPGLRRHVLHPIALDAAFHGLFENIRQRAGERFAYLPVRFASLRVDQDDAVPRRARVVVDRETDRLISISVALYDAEDRFVAGLEGGLFRAVTLDRRASASAFFHHRQVRLSRRCPGAAGIAAEAVAGAALAERPDAWLFLEGFARALAYHTLQALPAGAAALSGDAAPGALALALLGQLESAGLATRQEAGWRLAASSGLPEPGEILRSFAADYAGASAELVLAAQALSGLPAALAAGAPIVARAAILEQFAGGSILFAPLQAAVLAVAVALQAASGGARGDEALRVLVAAPFCVTVLQALVPLLRDRRVVVTVIGADARSLQQAAARHGGDGIAFLAVDGEDDAAEPVFDLAFGFAFGPVFGGEAALGRAVARRLSPDGVLCVLQPPASLVFDVLFGTGEDWFAQAGDASAPLGRVAAGQDTQRLLAASGFGGGEAVALGDGIGRVVLAVPDGSAARLSGGAATLVLVEDGGQTLPDAFASCWLDAGGLLRRVDAATPAGLAAGWREVAPRLVAGAPVDIVFAAGDAAPGGLDRTIARLAALLAALPSEGCRLWVVVRGLTAEAAGGIDPAAEAVWCFARVAANEYPGVSVRLVDLATDDAAAAALAGLIAAPGGDAELLIDDRGVSARRAAAGLPMQLAHAVAAVRLQPSAPGLQARFDWVGTARRAPGPGEIEVGIAAAGLNFRDVMLAAGLLDDDVLDDGLAGAVFGFECAGRVLRVGPGVDGVAPGEAVMGFARESFASHATADAAVFSKVPDGMPLEAAAAIPVAFLTAWYALVHQARIQSGEWVLIHGAAGGVGLAALQIARLHGARVAASVGAPDKRALVELFGAERVYDSRSTGFLDAVRREIGGVDVVLNSLAGEAMQAGLACLNPFGRFVELGKRDYVLNTSLGLRPFRRNLTYFGVDLDQLLAANLPLANRLMAEMMPHFGSGALQPLPYRAFEWHEAGRAFQLMQAAGHVGKLIVRPAAEPVATVVDEAPFLAGAGAHLVVGGTGGFGFATACWLAEHGAATVVVASRRGVIEAPLQARAAALRARGTVLIEAALDVTDGDAVEALVAALATAHGRIAGIVHAAMVLDDGMIAGLEPGRTRAVLAPKIDGAVNLDRASRRVGAPGDAGGGLDYFVAYSSVTTLIGNPGQAAYVAANGYLQGLMARRRADGLAGLAVGWGAIGDAGVLARDRDTAARLERVSGIVAMPARAALDQLGRLLAQGGGSPEAGLPTVYCAQFRPGALHGLALLAQPGLAGVFAAAENGEAAGGDLAAQIEGKNDGEARAIVARQVAGEVARIFRLAAEEIDVARPLDELGMDSMMSLDLRMGIETRFGIELPIVAMGAGTSVNDLATRLIGGLRGRGGQVPGEAATDEDAAPNDAARTAAERREVLRHGGEAGLDELMALSAAVRERDSAAALL